MKVGLFKRKPQEPEYEVKTLGNLIIERVQVPQTLTQQDGSKYTALAVDFRYRVEDGPILFERSYLIGEPVALKKISDILRPHIEVKDEYEAEWKFWQDFYWMMRVR